MARTPHWREALLDHGLRAQPSHLERPAGETIEAPLTSCLSLTHETPHVAGQMEKHWVGRWRADGQMVFIWVMIKPGPRVQTETGGIKRWTCSLPPASPCSSSWVRSLCLWIWDVPFKLISRLFSVWASHSLLPCPFLLLLLLPHTLLRSYPLVSLAASSKPILLFKIFLLGYSWFTILC